MSGHEQDHPFPLVGLLRVAGIGDDIRIGIGSTKRLHAATNEDRLRALRTDSVFSIVGLPGVGTPIPDEQIDPVRTIVQERLNWTSHPFLKIAQRVRIRSGALDGLEGILVSRSGGCTLVVSIDAIQRSLAVRIEGYDVEPA